MMYTRVKNTGKIPEQIALVKNCFDDTVLSRDIDNFLAKKEYYIAGRLPQNRRIRSNISNGMIWNHAMNARTQSPFVDLFERTLRAFKMLMTKKISKVWQS